MWKTKFEVCVQYSSFACLRWILQFTISYIYPIVRVENFNFCATLIFDQSLIDLEFGKHVRSMTKKVKNCIARIIIYEYNQILASLKEGLDIHPLASICIKSRRLVVEVDAWNINGRRCFPKIHLAHKGNWVCTFLGGRPLARLYQVACVVVK